MPKWTVDGNGVISLTLPMTAGRTGKGWFKHFREGVGNGDRTKSLLHSEQFQSTTSVINRIAILPGKLWSDRDRVTKRIRQDAYIGTFTTGQKLIDPNAEVACLVCGYLTPEEIRALGLTWIIIMHEPINDCDGDPSLLSVSSNGVGRLLEAYCDNPSFGWLPENGFAFAVVPVISQA